ncbi:hypothetical protein [Halalkalibacter wakoensis]|uniref:hypothetical protein n=1 Tax=Halalkalibacter wakoensis TaxID=127891 RepID=UPI0005541CA5|nr:hypothetical protein [Halalkalibacter wakoensis]
MQESGFCTECGKVKQNQKISFCNACYEVFRNDCQKVRSLLAENPKLTILDLVNVSGFSLQRVRQMIEYGALKIRE